MSGTIPGRQPRCGGSHKGALWLGLFIYMDGSVSYDNGTQKTGYGVVAYRKATEISSEKGPLGEFVEAYDMEIKALEAAAPCPGSAPLHMLPLLVCLFVYLCHQHMCCLFCLFVSPSRLVLLIYVQGTSAKSDCT